MKTISLIPFLMALATVWSGCVNLQPQPEVSRFFLPEANPVEHLPVREVQVARYLDQPRLTWRDGSEVRFLHNWHWAESLSRFLEFRYASRQSAASGEKSLILRLTEFGARLEEGNTYAVVRGSLVDAGTGEQWPFAWRQPWTDREPATLVGLLEAGLVAWEKDWKEGHHE